jgi:hypothetical protein
MSDNKIVHPEFAERMLHACDRNPDVPPINYGRLGWFVSQFKDRYDSDVTQETIRKWFAGESRPRHRAMTMLATILKVEESWLALGKDTSIPEKEHKIISSRASGAVNLIAGMVQLCGSTPAFPAKEGPIDLQAVIRAAMFNFHIVYGVPNTKGFTFSVRIDATECLVIAVVQLEPLQFEVFELDWKKIESLGSRKSGHFVVNETLEGLRTNWRKIETFSDRL